METTKLLGFLDPALNQIDNGNFFRKPFYWLYIIIGAANPLAALYFLIDTIRSGLLGHLKAGAVILFIVFWLVLLAISVIAFLLWWNRKDKVQAIADSKDNFVAIPVVTHLIQTAGEWIGMLVAVLGFTGSLLAILVSEIRYFVPVEYGAAGLIIYPIAGFLVVVLARFVAEAWRALADIANNTKRTAEK